MRRYLTCPAKAEWYDARATDFVARQVHDRDPSPRRTGLLDAHGNPLFLVDQMDPIGFQRLKERP